MRSKGWFDSCFSSDDTYFYDVCEPALEETREEDRLTLLCIMVWNVICIKISYLFLR